MTTAEQCAAENANLSRDLAVAASYTERATRARATSPESSQTTEAPTSL